MIEISGQSDIEIVFTGLRPGEKMHEELMGEAEHHRRTSHHLIDATEVPPLPIADVRAASMDWFSAEVA